MVCLNKDHLFPDQNFNNARKLGLLSGTKPAIEQGITTQVETLLGTGAMTNNNVRLSTKEEEYVLSQLMQKNFDARTGQAVFKSLTGRTTFKDKKAGTINPPMGFYEPQFAFV